MNIDWPVIYINLSTAEPLRLFTRRDWCDDLAARYSLSHITEGWHFFVDSSGLVYRLVGRGFISPGFQIIDAQPDDRPDVPGLVLKRAAACHGIAAGSISGIIAALGQKASS